MLHHKGYKYRIYPSKEQEQKIKLFFGCCRFVYNNSLLFNKETYSSDHRYVSSFENMRRITKLKTDPQYTWLKDCDSHALQEAIKDLGRAYQAFLKNGAGLPQYRSKRKHAQSYRTVNNYNAVRFESGKIRIPKLGLIKIKKSREIQGRIINATISCTASGKYFVSLCVEEEAVIKPNGGGVVGIDVGIKNFYTDSNGCVVHNPKVFEKNKKRLAKENKRLSRKKKDSNNWNKQRIKLAKAYDKIANQRADFLHKESSKLVIENQVIALEDLNVCGMAKNRKLAKAIFDASWGSFVKLLEYKSFEHGTKIVRVPRFFASSQICSSCGEKNSFVKDLSVRKWTCQNCGVIHDRDHNAAINILNYALMTT